MKNLISMTDFVLSERGAKDGCKNSFLRCINYAIFIKQTLELWMFVPCSKDGDILEEPIETIGGVEMYFKKYQQAKERCLFKGFEVNPKGYADYTEDYLKIDEEYCQNLTIEDLVCFNLKLSKTAIKELGL